MDSKKRTRIGFLSSFVIHIIIFLLAAFGGIFSFSHAQDEDIVEVAIFGGGGGGGGSGSDAGENIEEETPEESQEEAEAEQQADEDSILQKSDAAEKIAPRQHKPAQYKKQGTGTGQGTGHGSGTGSGTGSGSGSGTGSGHGSGTGSGYGPGSGDGPTSSPAIPPRIIRSKKAEYPAAERNAGVEGVTVIRFLIGSGGEVESVTVARSSGSAALDNAAVAAGYQFRFSPARNSAGQNVRCYANMPIEFSLRR